MTRIIELLPARVQNRGSKRKGQATTNLALTTAYLGGSEGARGPENNVCRVAPFLFSNCRPARGPALLVCSGRNTRPSRHGATAYRTLKRLSFVTGIFFLGTREQHSSLTLQAHWKNEIVLGEHLRCII